METATLLIVAKRRSFTTEAVHDVAMELSTEVGRLILGMMSSLRQYRLNG